MLNDKKIFNDFIIISIFWNIYRYTENDDVEFI